MENLQRSYLPKKKRTGKNASEMTLLEHALHKIVMRHFSLYLSKIY